MKNFGRITMACAAGAIALGVVGTKDASAGESDGNAWTAAQLNTYSCNQGDYGAAGSYFANVMGNGTYRRQSTYTCLESDTSNAASAVVTSLETLRAATAQTVGIIAQRISNVRNASSAKSPTFGFLTRDKGEIGLAGGDKKRGIGVWVQGSYTNVDNDASAGAYDGDIYTGMVGIDKEINSKVLVGLALGYEGTDIDTAFNSGGIESDGFIVSPYLAINIAKIGGVDVSADATAGWAHLNYEANRKDSITSSTYNSDFDANRYWGSVNLNANMAVNEKLNVGLNAGLIHTNERKDDYTELTTENLAFNADQVKVEEQTTRLTQVRFGVGASYKVNPMVTPFLDVTAGYDANKSRVADVASNQTALANDDWGVTIGGGVNLNIMPNLKARVEGSTVQGRDDWQEYTGMATVRYEF